jgi:hypothetical protein
MQDLSDCANIHLPSEGCEDLRSRLEASRNAHLDLALRDLNSDAGVQAQFQAQIEDCLIERLETDRDELEAGSPFRIILSQQSGFGHELGETRLQLFKAAWQQVSNEVASWVPPSVQAQ